MAEFARKNPKNLQAHLQLAIRYSQAEQYDLAVNHYKKAAQLDKKNPVILKPLIKSLMHAKSYAEAGKLSRKLTFLSPGDGEAHYLMAKCLEEQGLSDQALPVIDKALSVEPEHANYLIKRAELLAKTGYLEESAAIYHRLIEEDFQLSQCYWPIAQSEKFSGDRANNLLSTIDKALDWYENHKTLSSDDKQGHVRGIYFAKGKILQDLGHYEAAFKAFEKANHAQPEQATADRIIAARLNILEAFTGERFQAKAQLGDKKAQPIFIFGMPRSGTTLIESICAAHSKVTAGDELPYIANFNRQLGLYSLNDGEYEEAIGQLDRKVLAQFARSYQESTRALRGKYPMLTDKMPHNFLNLGLIALIFPNAKLIHCRRHPLDNCLSLYTNSMIEYHREYKCEFETLGRHYQQYVQIMDHWKEVCPLPILDVFYEDVVTNSEAASRELIQFLGLDWEDGVMNRQNAQHSVRTLSIWQVRQPVYQSSKGKWRHYERQLAPLADILAQEVQQYEQLLATLDKAKSSKT